MPSNTWLEAELAKIQPAAVVALGSTALKSVLEDSRATLKAFMDAPVRYGTYQVVATYHPAFILRLPDQNAREQVMAALELTFCKKVGTFFTCSGNIHKNTAMICPRYFEKDSDDQEIIAGRFVRQCMPGASRGHG